MKGKIITNRCYLLFIQNVCSCRLFLAIKRLTNRVSWDKCFSGRSMKERKPRREGYVMAICHYRHIPSISLYQNQRRCQGISCLPSQPRTGISLLHISSPHHIYSEVPSTDPKEQVLAFALQNSQFQPSFPSF